MFPINSSFFFIFFPIFLFFSAPPVSWLQVRPFLSATFLWAYRASPPLHKMVAVKKNTFFPGQIRPACRGQCGKSIPVLFVFEKSKRMYNGHIQIVSTASNLTKLKLSDGEPHLTSLTFDLRRFLTLSSIRVCLPSWPLSTHQPPRQDNGVV